MDISLMKDEHGSCYGYCIPGHVDKTEFALVASVWEMMEFIVPDATGYDAEGVNYIYLGELPYTILEI